MKTQWYAIYDRKLDGQEGGLVFDCCAESLDDAHSQVKDLHWPNGFIIRLISSMVCSYPGNSPADGEDVE